MTTQAAGATSTRQNDAGSASSAATIVARITAGCVTAAVRKGLAVNAFNQRDARSIRSAIDSPPCSARPDRSATPPGRLGPRSAAPARTTARNPGRPAAVRLPRQAEQPRGLPGAQLGCDEIACGAIELGGDSFYLTAAQLVQRLVGGKTPVRHGIRHAMRNERQPHDPGHAGTRGARAPSSRPLTAAKTRPMPAHSTSCAASDTSRNS